MTAKTIASVEVYLNFGRFGSPTELAEPLDGVTGSSHHNVAGKGRYRLGTVLQLWNPGDGTGSVPGWSEFVYGQWDKNDQATSAALLIAMPTAITNLYNITDDPNDCASLAAAALAVVALSAMTDNYYGWFWSGGIAPIDLVADATFAATDTMVSATGAITVGEPLYALGSGEGFSWEVDPEDASVTACAVALAADDA